MKLRNHENHIHSLKWRGKSFENSPIRILRMKNRESCNFYFILLISSALERLITDDWAWISIYIIRQKLMFYRWAHAIKRKKCYCIKFHHSIDLVWLICCKSEHDDFPVSRALGYHRHKPCNEIARARLLTFAPSLESSIFFSLCLFILSVFA